MKKTTACCSVAFLLLVTGACNNYDLVEKLKNPGSGGSSGTFVEKFTTNNYIFVSSWTTQGAMAGSPYNSDCSSSVGDGKADCACTRAAAARGLRRNSTHVFRAWLSTSGTNATCRVQGLPNGCGTSFPVPWFNTNAETVLNNFSALTTGTIVTAVRYDEFGVDQGITQVWTGTSATGSTIASFNCSDWTDQTAGSNGQYGDRTVTPSTWTTTASANCANNYRIYCVAAP